MNKKQIIQYIRYHYASLYFRGFGLFGTVVSLVTGVYVLQNKITFQPEFYGLVIFVMFAWFFFDFTDKMAREMEKNENKKLLSVSTKRKEGEKK